VLSRSSSSLFEKLKSRFGSMNCIVHKNKKEKEMGHSKRKKWSSQKEQKNEIEFSK
jgi:hypothetical protein